MKNIFLTFSLLISFNLFSQTMPVEELWKYYDGILQAEPEDFNKIKDINNVLDKFAGAWTTTYNNKEYLIFIEEVIGYPENNSVEEFDGLSLTYRVTNSSGLIIRDTTLPSTKYFYIVDNGYVKEDGSYYFSYFADQDHSCKGNSGPLEIAINNTNQNEMTLKFIPKRQERIFGGNFCEEEDFLFPTAGFTLTKQ